MSRLPGGRGVRKKRNVRERERIDARHRVRGGGVSYSSTEEFPSISTTRDKRVRAVRKWSAPLEVEKPGRRKQSSNAAEIIRHTYGERILLNISRHEGASDD